MLKCIETPTNQDAELLLVEIYSSGVEIHRSGVLLNPSLLLLLPQSLPLGSRSFGPTSVIPRPPDKEGSLL